MHELTLAGLRVHSSLSPATSAAPPKAAVVLLHGYGAPGTDLLSLTGGLRVPRETAFFFPEGPLDLSEQYGAGYAQARAWWPIDMVRLQVAMMTGAVEQLGKQLAVGVEDACARLIRLLDELQARFELVPERIVLGGFSQGSIVSLEVALESERRFAGLLLMSSTMLDEQRLRQGAMRRRGTRALVSHGRSDPILPYSVAEALADNLRKAQWEVQWVPFTGGHGIPLGVIDVASDLVSHWLGGFGQGRADEAPDKC